MKNILFLTNMLPFKAQSGGTIVTERVLRELVERNFNVYLYFIDTSDGSEAQYYKKMLGAKFKKFVVIHNSNNVRSIKNMILSILKGLPLNVYRNYCEDMKEEVNSLLETNVIDSIYCDHLEMIQYVPREFLQRTFLFEHNVEYMIWQRYSDRIGNLMLKYGVRFEAQRIKRFELKKCKEVAKIFASPNDADFLCSLDKNKIMNKYIHINLCGDDELLQKPIVSKKSQFCVLFVGTMTWQANIDGVNWFVKNVWPNVVSEYPDAEFNIIGKLPDDGNVKFEQGINVNYLGFVDELEDYYTSATVFVCPVLFGSGTKIKIINALYRGIPIVTTTVGAESIDLISGENSFVEDQPIKCAENIIRLWVDDELWSRFSRNGRELAQNEFLWKTQIDKICKVIDE